MIYYKTTDEIELIKRSCMVVCNALARVAELIGPGVSGTEIDRAAEEVIRDMNAIPGFKGLNGFPATLCVSVNEAVVHGIPGKGEFQEGDIVSVDCGAIVDGFYGDSAFTFAVGEISDEVLKLLTVTKESLYLGIDQAVVGKRIGDISFAIQSHTERKHNYGIVRELVGHGIGREIHEKPEVPNYGKRGRGTRIREGLVIAIEPMVNLGTKDVVTSEDGWTVKTKDGLPSAHYEHTVVPGKRKAEILSDHEIIEQKVKNNNNINTVSINF